MRNEVRAIWKAERKMRIGGDAGNHKHSVFPKVMLLPSQRLAAHHAERSCRCLFYSILRPVVSLDTQRVSDSLASER